MNKIQEMLDELNSMHPGWKAYDYTTGNEDRFFYVHNEYISVTYDKKDNCYDTISNIFDTDHDLIKGHGTTATEAVIDLKNKIQVHFDDLKNKIQVHFDEIQNILSSIG